jgi:tryptophanyl-tRNA synthetase
MSKSHGNTIPLFCERPELRKLVRRMATDSTPVDAPKDPDTSAVFGVYKQFASPADVQGVRERLQSGAMGWGEFKDVLFEQLDRTLSDPRERYRELMEDRKQLDGILAVGNTQARERTSRFLRAVREAIGID